MVYSVFFDLENKKKERSKEKRKKDNNDLQIMKATLIMKITTLLSLVAIINSLLTG